MKKLFIICCGMMVLLCACNPVNETAEFSVHSNDGTTLATVKVGSEQIVVDRPEGSLTGIFKKEKRKYYDGSNTMRYAVKFSEDGFKLRDFREELLWKVKIYDDKIKLADNEEMNNAYEIKLREAGKVKLERNDQPLTELRMNDAAEWFQVNEQLKTKGAGLSLVPALLLIKELEPAEQYILMAELKDKGK